MIRLKERYQKEVILAMQEKFGYSNLMAVPRIEKVVVNTGFGRLVGGQSRKDAQQIQKNTSRDLALITGQKPILTAARKSISTFKIRKGMIIGAKVTLRGRRMYDFLERLINIALPRSRDFEGIDSNSMDQMGNLTIAIKEHIVFPEVLAEKAKDIFGFEITVVTTAKSKEEGLRLLRLLGLPIK